MKLFTKFISIILAFCMLQGCSGDGMNKQGAGTLLGGLAGGVVGSRFGKGEGALLATGVGALAGAMVGSHIGKSLDDKDRQILALTSQRALETAPSESTTEWNNPDSGHYGEVIPHKPYKNENGQYCREYTQNVVVGGEKQKAYGKACRQKDGQWRIIK